MLASGLASDDPRKKPLERALVEELEKTREAWLAVLAVHPSHNWWALKLTRIRDGFAHSLVIGERQQTEAALRKSVRTAVEAAASSARHAARAPGNPEVF